MRKWILPYIKANKGRMVLSLFIGILGVGSGAMLLFVSGYLISKSSLMPVNIMAVYVPIVSVRAFSIGRAVFTYLERLISHDLVLRILEKMRRRLYDILEPKALFLSSKHKTGDLLGLLSDDIEHLQDLYLRTVFPSILGLAIYSIIVLVFGTFNLTFGLMIAALLGVVVFLLPYLSYLGNKGNHQSQKENRAELYSKLTDGIFGMTDWKASGREGEFLAELEGQDEEMIQTERRIKRLRHFRGAITELMIGLSVIAVMIFASLAAEASLIQPTVIAAFVLMIFAVADALRPISEALEPITLYSDSLARLEGLETSELPSVFRRDFKNSLRGEATIEFNQVSYSYPGEDRRILDGLDLRIEPGEKVALLGRSGSGKSTLLKLLAGALEPEQGRVTIKGEEMHSGRLAQSVSILNQKPHLFATTIGNNIRIGRPGAEDEEIELAAELAQLSSLIRDLPQGFQTNMEEMGQRFSGGEGQRIAFARVLLQDTPILLVDEATIGLDPITEQGLINTIFTAAKDKTILWVTHHLAGVENMDRIIFLEDGRIKMDGSHQELLEENEHYRRLYQMDQGHIN